MRIMSYEASILFQTKITPIPNPACMNVAVLFSGGKDSTYSAFLAKNQGHVIKCLLTVIPRSDESYLLHHPNTTWTWLQSQSMDMPQLVAKAGSESPEAEADTMMHLLLKAKNTLGIDGLVHGGISSNFQRTRFERVCKKCDIKVLCPLWGKDPASYTGELLDNGFQYIVTSVSAGGLDESWLGKKITRHNVQELTDLAVKHGFNLDFEGGEAETFVVDCPLFSNPITIRRARNTWDGYRGRFEIIDAGLSSNA